MEYLGNKSLYQMLRNANDCDYVTFVMTLWHVHAFTAALRKIESKEKRKLKGIVIIKPHEVSGWLVGESDFPDDENIIKIYRYQDDESLLDRLTYEIKGIYYYFGLRRNNSTRFYFFKPNGFRYPVLALLHNGCKGKKQICAVSVDEGVGIYTNFNTQALLTSLKIVWDSRLPFKDKMFSFVKAFETRVFSENRLKITDHYVDCNLMVIRENNICVSNGSMPKYFKEVIESFSENVMIDIPIISNEYVLINTQPVDGFSISGKDVQFDVLTLCVPLFKRAGFSVVIKPHPREMDIEKYNTLNVIVMDCKGVSQESLLCKMKKPACIVSCCSTTLVSTHLFWNINAISLTKLFLMTGDISRDYKDIFKKFETAFHNMLLFPDNYDKLADFLKHEKV